MKRIYNVENLECAHCAAKIEDAIKKLDGVNSVSVNFFTQKITLDACDESFDNVLKNAIKLTSRIEHDCRILV